MSVRVLLIEDDEDDYLLTLDCIEAITNARYVVDWVSDGMAAAAGEIDFSEADVILCDYRVGGVTGVEIVEAAVARGVDAPFILLTGHSDREIDFAAMQAGAVDHLVKDRISPAVLEKTIRYAMNSADAARALRKQSEILRATMDATDIGMAAIEAGGGAPIWNAPMAEMMAEDPTDADAIRARIETLCASPELIAGERIELPRADGAGIVEASLKPLTGGGCTLACVDVSKHKAIEDALRSSKEEAERLSMAKSQFIARLSHEMRTPLHAVIGFAELLPSAGASELPDYSNIIVSSSRGLVAKIDQMLELARMDLGQARHAMRSVPVQAILREAMDRAVRADPTLANRLRLEAACSGLRALGDHQSLAKAVAEFIANAAKYGDGSEIRVGAERGEAGLVRCWVANDPAEGLALPAGDVFESFGQADQRLERAHEGLGVGLTYVRAVATVHGGDASLAASDQTGEIIAALTLPEAEATAEGVRGAA